MERELKASLNERGADIIRFVDISQLSPEQTQGFTKAIIICMALSKDFVWDMYNKTPVEHDDYLDKEEKVNELADWLEEYIQQQGYSAYSQSENNNEKTGNYSPQTRTSTLPHKTIALLGGLGFIGKNNLLISEEYGCAFCMCTLLTDAPIPVEKYPLTPSKCGECEVCKNVCPAKAIHGNKWSEDGSRENIVDVFKCSCALKCMVNCPWTLRYAKV